MGRWRSIWEQCDTEDIAEKRERTEKKWSRRHLGDKERDGEDFLLDDPYKNGILKKEGNGGEEDAVMVMVVLFIFTSGTCLILGTQAQVFLS